MSMNKLKFELGTDKLAIRKPTPAELNMAQKLYSKKFCDLVKAGIIVRAKIDQVMKEQGLWDEAKAAELTELRKVLQDGELKLKRGGVKLSEASKIAFDMYDARMKIQDLDSPRASIDVNCCESQAENDRFNYLVSVCTVYDNTGEPYFNSLEDYMNRADSDEGRTCAIKCAFFHNGLEEDYASKWPENEFLKKFGFVDDKLRLVDKQKRLVDRKGRFVDDNGRFIKYKEDGTTFFVDAQGNPVNESGDYMVDAQPFLDDEGVPIVETNTAVATVAEVTK